MNNFIFENSSKVYFGEGCVKEYLSGILSHYGKTVKEPGVDESVDLKEIAESCNIMPGSYKKMTHEEILKILEECK